MLVADQPRPPSRVVGQQIQTQDTQHVGVLGQWIIVTRNPPHNIYTDQVLAVSLKWRLVCVFCLVTLPKAGHGCFLATIMGGGPGGTCRRKLSYTRGAVRIGVK